MDRKTVRWLAQQATRSLSGFDRGSITLPTLVADLESYVDALQNVADHDWVDELRSFVNQLEFANAVAIEGRHTKRSSRDGGTLAEALIGLRLMLEEY